MSELANGLLSSWKAAGPGAPHCYTRANSTSTCRTELASQSCTGMASKEATVLWLSISWGPAWKICSSSAEVSLKTVLMPADQLISRLEFLHQRSFIHRGSTKPDNFLMGLGDKVNQVYIIDFELVKKYRDPKSLVHIPYREHRDFVGNPIFASINAHEGIEASRRDDLESLGYMMVYFLQGSLPWQSIPAYRLSAKSRFGRRQVLQEFMHEEKLCHIEELTQDCPAEFTKYFKYVRALRYDEQPDYNYLRKLFRDLFDREGYQWDHVFDWYARRQQWSQCTEQQPESVKEPQRPPQQDGRAKEPQQLQQEDESAKEPQQPQQEDESAKEPQQPQQQQDEGAKQSQQPQQGQGLTATEATVEPGEAYRLDYGTYWLAAEDPVTAVPGGGGYLS